MQALQVKKMVYAKINQIAQTQNESLQRMELAKLRRGIGKAPGDIPELWGALFGGMPSEMMVTYDHPSYIEWAIYTALTLYAFHQQGKDSIKEPMHVLGQHFGSAVAELVHSEDDQKRILRRFNRFATASDMDEMTTHLRGLIGLLKSEGISIDYGELAEDIYRYLCSYDFRESVRLKWGRDFFKNLNINAKGDTENE